MIKNHLVEKIPIDINAEFAMQGDISKLSRFMIVIMIMIIVIGYYILVLK
jgi:hypothetical protein